MSQKSINDFCTVFHALSHGIGGKYSFFQEDVELVWCLYHYITLPLSSSLLIRPYPFQPFNPTTSYRSLPMLPCAHSAVQNRGERQAPARAVEACSGAGKRSGQCVPGECTASGPTRASSQIQLRPKKGLKSLTKTNCYFPNQARRNGLFAPPLPTHDPELCPLLA